MTAEILSVGTELLLGNIVDTNAAYIAQELASLGISVYRKTTVGDNYDRLLAAITHAFENADLVVISGGLGPTQDDITKTVAAEYFGRELVLHEESMRRIEKRFAGRGLPVNSEKNALIPEGAHVLPNDNGSAPGIILTGHMPVDCHGSPSLAMTGKSKMLILLPGPPHEMTPMFANYAVPYLQAKSGMVFISRTLKIIGIGESKVEDMLIDLISAQTNPTIAPYAKVGEVHVRLTASAKTEAEANTLLEPVMQEIEKRLYPHIYSTDGSTPAEVVIERLRNKSGGSKSEPTGTKIVPVENCTPHTLAVAESCTGGLIMSQLVAVAGCSDVILEGLCTYSNEAKIARLGIPPEMLEEYGAVSPQVAAAMAENAARTSGASVGLSTTGIAGPGGGTPDKPVGLVYIGLYANGKTITEKFNLIGSRNEVRTRAANLALDLLRKKLNHEKHEIHEKK